MTGQRKQPNLQHKDYPQEAEMESRVNEGEQSYVKTATEGSDKNKKHDKLLELILTRDNMNLAYERVKSNKGSAGIDKMRVDELLDYLKENGKELLERLSTGRYQPQAVRRVEIPKPEGGVRLLGIPTVVDRMIQQAISQVLSPLFDEGFSKHSYGFRPNKNAHQAMLQAKAYINSGWKYVVDIDLEKFFDKVNHGKLMHQLSKKIADRRVLNLIRLYLTSGVMIGGLYSKTEEGTPQGGPLSPLLSNIMLDELDKELEKRGHKFCRYADDCNIYVRSIRSAARVMRSVTNFIESNLKLKVNTQKSEVGKPQERKFLGFSFYQIKGEFRIRLHSKALERVKEKVKQLTSRSNGLSMEDRIKKLSSLIGGWVGYFKLGDIKGHCQRLDEWMRRRLRMCYWKQWKKVRTKYEQLQNLGLPAPQAWEYANTRKSYWRIANSPILARTLTNKHFEDLKLYTFTRAYC